MLRLPDSEPSASTLTVLGKLQGEVDAGADFVARATLAKTWWDRKNGTQARKTAFSEVRGLLGEMAFGSVRCAYCEDSAADEIEHIAPKTIFPSRCFDWANYCFACGPCNGPKGNRFATISINGDRHVISAADLAVEPASAPALIDPRRENPTDFLELDIGGVAADGLILLSTSEFLVREDIDAVAQARAQWTIEVLDLNRELVRKARETSYQSYRAALTEYRVRGRTMCRKP